MKRDFYLLQTASFLGTIATRCLEVAVAWWVLRETGNPALFGALVALGIGADVLSRGALAWLGDRFDGRVVVLCCYVAGGLISSTLAVAAWTGTYSLWLVSAAIVALGAGLGVREPLQMSLIRELVQRADVADAVRIRSAVMSSSAFAGPIVAGALIGPFGYRTVLTLSAAVVVSSAVLVLVMDRQETVPGAASGGAARWVGDVVAGFRAVRRVTPEWRLAITTMVVNFALYPVFAVIIPIVVVERFAAESWVLSVVESAFAVGLIAGSTFVTRRITGLLGRRRTVVSGFGALGLGFVGAGAAGGLAGSGPLVFSAVSSLFLLAAGTGLSMVVVNTGAVRVLATPSSYRNRMVASVSFLSGIVMPLGALLGGLISGGLNSSASLVILGLLICACAAVISRDRVLGRFLSMSDDDLDGAYAKHFPEAFVA
ncbi:MFS transporter [Kribbella sp. NPDC005582]|uniref:MFS transporter n=1 Tax=Kribbella sp. NPDC005582 TaxID=3156893 RepID=UPI0033BB8547